jgi:DtxR family Mn-dependent transcriptional regulator
MTEHITPNMEMYLKTILEIASDGEAPRVKAIAQRLGVTMPSVSGAVESLQSRGLVEHNPYGAVKLTHEGEKRAREVKTRNDLLYRFLLDVLQLPQEQASTEACELEHVVSEQTLERISSFLEFAGVRDGETSGIVADFRDWLAQNSSLPQRPLG